jgi:hypothetical protein
LPVTTDADDDRGPLAVLYRLHRQLRILVSTFTVAADTPEAAAMLAGLADTATQAAALLATADPDTLTALHRAFGHVRARRYNEACTEFIAAHRRLALMLHRDDRPRRAAAADEPTKRWRLEP